MSDGRAERDADIDDQGWTDISGLVDSGIMCPSNRRHVSPKTTIELYPAGSTRVRKFEVQRSVANILLFFGPQTSWEAENSDRLQLRRFRNRSHFLPAKTHQRVLIDTPVPEMLSISMDQEFARETMETLRDGATVEDRSLIGDARPAFMTLGKTIRSQILAGRRLGTLQLESFATLCLAECTQDVASVPPVSSISKVLDRLDDYIQEHLDNDLSLRELANVAGLSPSYFLRSFKKATGQTPHRYLMECRLRRARDQLVQTDLPIADIAYASGFASQSHLNDVFRTKLGISPGQYRRIERS